MKQTSAKFSVVDALPNPTHRLVVADAVMAYDGAKIEAAEASALAERRWKPLGHDIVSRHRILAPGEIAIRTLNRASAPWIGHLLSIVMGISVLAAIRFLPLFALILD